MDVRRLNTSTYIMLCMYDCMDRNFGKKLMASVSCYEIGNLMNFM